jgi:hypothetical protein
MLRKNRTIVRGITESLGTNILMSSRAAQAAPAHRQSRHRQTRLLIQAITGPSRFIVGRTASHTRARSKLCHSTEHPLQNDSEIDASATSSGARCSLLYLPGVRPSRRCGRHRPPQERNARLFPTPIRFGDSRSCDRSGRQGQRCLIEAARAISVECFC